MPFVFTPALAFWSDEVVGANWALLPSAAGFVDPLLSTGFPLTLLGVQRLACLLNESWQRPDFCQRLNSYAAATEAEFRSAEVLVAALYANMHDFPVFRALSLLYFAAASFSETVRRMGRNHLANGFLLSQNHGFTVDLMRCCEVARRAPPHNKSTWNQHRSDLAARVARAIEPFDVAGLNNQARRHWYPVDADDLLRAAQRLGIDRTEVQDLLIRSGFFETPAQPDSNSNQPCSYGDGANSLPTLAHG
jgi:FADH2 O2-dependent halogenase